MNAVSPAGLSLLRRRDFLARAGQGLGGIALASLLSEQGLLASNPIRPLIRPEGPLGARAPHFAAKAKRALVIYCSGACSHLDSWDYKPELIQRHGEALPGQE